MATSPSRLWRGAYSLIERKDLLTPAVVLGESEETHDAAGPKLQRKARRGLEE